MNTTSTITTQREQRRTEAIRMAEHASDLASACEWWADVIPTVSAATDAQRMIAGELLANLTKWGKQLRQTAAHHTDRAATITSNLTAAARSQQS